MKTNGLLFLFCCIYSLIVAQPIQYFTKTYDTQNHGADKAVAVATDANCYVYVTGTSEGISTGVDYLTIKYDVNGNVVWTQRYDGPAHGDDEPVAIAVDANGNVYVTGKSQGVGVGYDYATVKYDANGALQWGGARRFNNTNTGGNGDDVASVLALDATGQYLYVGGTSFNYVSSSSDKDVVVLKYDAGTGSAVWNTPASYNESAAWVNIIKGMAIDGSGNVYVISSNGNPSIPMYSWGTLKFNSSGVQTNLLTDGFSGNSTPLALDVDNSGNVYVAGGDPDASRITVKKYYASGSIFGSTYSTSLTNGLGAGTYAFAGAGIKVQSGNVYGFINTDYNSTAAFNYDVLTFKLNMNGDTAWTHRYGASGEDKGMSLALDASENIYVTGYTTNTNKDIFITKYANGSGAMSSGYPIIYSGSANQDDGGNHVIVTPENNVLVAGYTTATTSQEDFFVRKYVQFIPVADVGTIHDACFGSQVQIGAASNPGYSYSWSPSFSLSDVSASNPFVTPTSTITYELTVMAGCASDSASLTLTMNPLPSVSLSGNPDTLYTSDAPIQLGGGTPSGGSYSGSGVSNTQFNPAAAGAGLQSITYTYTDGNGCTNGASEDIFVIDTTQTGFTTVSEDQLTIFPNPSTGTIELRYRMQYIGSVQIKLYNIEGQLVRLEEIKTMSALVQQKMNLGDLPKGLYVLQMNSGQQSITKRIEIK